VRASARPERHLDSPVIHPTEAVCMDTHTPRPRCYTPARRSEGRTSPYRASGPGTSLDRPTVAIRSCLECPHFTIAVKHEALSAIPTATCGGSKWFGHMLDIAQSHVTT